MERELSYEESLLLYQAPSGPPPVRRLGSGWIWEWSPGFKGPRVFRTRREAVAHWESYVRELSRVRMHHMRPAMAVAQ